MQGSGFRVQGFMVILLQLSVAWHLVLLRARKLPSA